jgi:hypothetical protein
MYHNLKVVSRQANIRKKMKSAKRKELTIKNSLKELNQSMLSNRYILEQISMIRNGPTSHSIAHSAAKDMYLRADKNTIQADKLKRVNLRVVFLRIGEIDTVKEQFQAEILIEANWVEPSLNITVLSHLYVYCNYFAIVIFSFM